jgi:hypothetical protein
VQITDEPAESVKVIKLIDQSVPEAAPVIRAEVPASTKPGETFRVSGDTDAGSVPVVEYSWNFGDGVSAQGRNAKHAYTHAGEFTIVLRAEGVDGGESQKSFTVKVTGKLDAFTKLRDNKRFREPADH